MGIEILWLNYFIALFKGEVLIVGVLILLKFCKVSYNYFYKNKIKEFTPTSADVDIRNMLLSMYRYTRNVIIFIACLIPFTMILGGQYSPKIIIESTPIKEHIREEKEMKVLKPRVMSNEDRLKYTNELFNENKVDTND